MTNQIANIYYKQVGGQEYDLFLLFEGGCVMWHSEITVKNIDAESTRRLVDSIHFRPSRHNQQWLDTHCEWWGATQTCHQARI